MRRESPDARTPNDTHLAALDRVCSGEATAADVASVTAWLARHPEQRDVYDRLVGGLRDMRREDATRRTPSAIRTSAQVDAILRHCVTAPHVPQTSDRGRHAVAVPFIGSRMRRPVVAFTTLVTLCVAALAVLTSSVGRNQNAPQRSSVYATKSGERLAVTLASGVRVTLAPGSQLIVTANQTVAHTVELRGEAYFEISSHRAVVPFSVRAGDASIRVLGTAFNVRHYATDRFVHVAVIDGKVSAQSRRAVVTLSGGMTARLADSAEVTREDARAAARWIDGRLTFRDARVVDVLDDIGRWYGYEFKLADSALAAQRITTVLVANNSAHTLRLLEDLLNVTMTRNGKTIMVESRARSDSAAARHRRFTPQLYSTPSEAGK